MHARTFEGLKGRTWLLNGKQKHVEAVIVRGELTTVYFNDQTSETYRNQDEDDVLEDYLPVYGLTTEIKMPDMTDIFTLLRGNLTKIESNPSYIGQAEAINSTVNTMMNMLKVQLQYKKSKGGQ